MWNLKQKAWLAVLGAALSCSAPISSHAQDQRAAHALKVQRGGERPTAQFCRLGRQDCLALASRPFKPCLLATDRCAQDVQVYPAHGRAAHGK